MAHPQVRWGQLPTALDSHAEVNILGVARAWLCVSIGGCCVQGSKGRRPQVLFKEQASVPSSDNPPGAAVERKCDEVCKTVDKVPGIHILSRNGSRHSPSPCVNAVRRPRGVEAQGRGRCSLL